ncbi:hypothetical protein HPB50_002970 [Hyalomma asiaticum]|uniref:Uncharacterized protein n=1 Tax=Hyalomma asiaticum TaxID=266040 RepID=A0ACB7TBH0_HYAAI|nr:hypothetical protein HPB50_002970 [Hyalomma asiaticum]
MLSYEDVFNTEGVSTWGGDGNARIYCSYEQRTESRTKSSQIRDGDVLIVREENTSPGFWKLGRVMPYTSGETDSSERAPCFLQVATKRTAPYRTCTIWKPRNEPKPPPVT